MWTIIKNYSYRRVYKLNLFGYGIELRLFIWNKRKGERVRKKLEKYIREIEYGL